MSTAPSLVGKSNVLKTREPRVRTSVCTNFFDCLFVCLPAGFLKIEGNVNQQLGYDPRYLVGS